MKRCDRCQHGINSNDDAGTAYVVCALIPPTPIPAPLIEDNQIVTRVTWHRPPMASAGWCGQFKLSWKKLLFRHGPRT